MDEEDIEMFDQLCKALKGKDGYLFLVNDSKQEIRQHYDPNFKYDSFNEDKMRETINYKKDYLNRRGCSYGLYVFTDKSVVLRKYLPFDTCEPIRYIDKLKDCLYDLNEVLEEEDFSHGDTHCSMRASIRVVSYILEKKFNKLSEQSITELMDNTDWSLSDIIQFKIKSRSEDITYEDVLKSKLEIKIEPHHEDLYDVFNYSYPEENLLFKDRNEDLIALYPKDEYTDKKDTIPKEFRKVKNRESQYYYNEHSLTNRKALILHDSSVLNLIPVLICVYRELFLYWDYGIFNKRLVEWYDPDDCLEIRIERIVTAIKHIIP